MTTSYVDALAEQRTVTFAPISDLHPHPHNPRRDLGDLTELADSIRAHGIRQDLLVVPNPDVEQGGWRIVIGHRRHAAAALAGADTVPVRVDATLDEIGQRELMLVENLQRTDLSPVEEADAYQGLLDLGLSATAIARQTGRAVATVRSRLKIRTLSEDARSKLHEGKGATLEDAAAVVRIAAKHPDLGAKLDKALGSARFGHDLEVAQREVKSRADRARLLKELEAAGVPVVDDETGTQLRDLRDAEGGWIGDDGHASCPGHAVQLWDTWSGWRALAVCLDPEGNGHARHRAVGGGSPSAQSDGEKAEERRRVLANNKASRAAAAVREEFVVRGLLDRKGLPDGWAAYAVAMSLSREVYGEHVRAGELLRLGDNWPGGDAITAATMAAGSQFAQKYLIATAIARGEDKLPVDFWRNCFDKPTAVRHLLWLRRWGYTLSDLEQAFVDEHRTAAPELGEQ